jgi:hypothetical protein
MALVLMVVICGTAAGDSWVTVDPSGAAIMGESGPTQVPVVEPMKSGPEGFDARVGTAGFGVSIEDTSAGEFVRLYWPDASIAGEVGEPAMPVVRRLFVAPPGAQVTVSTFEGEPTVIDLEAAGLPWRVMPAQPPIEKLPGAIEQAVFQFNEAAYTGRAHFATERALVQEVGMARGQRLFLLEVRPIAYDPDTRSLSVWSDLEAQIEFSGARANPVSLSPPPGLSGAVLNPAQLPAFARIEAGNYLIIVDVAYESAIASFASAKEDQGFTVTTYTVDGDSNSAIKSYIQSLWGGADSPDFILLVGDTDTIPHWTGGGYGSPSTDLPYSCMDGSTDWYPDIALGRFPVRSTSHLTAIVDKTLYYENGPLADPDYKMRAVFMASTDNYTVSEGTHNWVISNYMDPNGYTSDKLYTWTYNATTQDVRDAFNDGRFFGIYSGHGAETYWADGPVFYQSDVNGLTNTNMYPFVCSFACVTGTYTLNECFVETWIRAADKGAIAIYGSSVNSYWTEDDVLEKRLFDSIFDEGDDVPDRVGPVWNDTRMRYLTQMGSGSTTRRYFEMYNLMGDPSLLFFGSEAPPTGLKVSPADGLVSEGPTGGPFTPDSIVYTLENQNDTGIDYVVTKSESWVSLSDTGGYLPGHATVDVTVSINADTLPTGPYADTINFINTTDHDGDATRSVDLTVGVPTLQLFWNLDTDPGWDTEGLWAWGQPTGGGGSYGNPDPTSGYTGTNVYGYNLDGDYTNSMPAAEYLTTTAIDCSTYAFVQLKFRRWLGVERSRYDHATVEVSTDGTNWTLVWENSESAAISDADWSYESYELGPIADGQSTVYLRWGMGPTDGSVVYSGWNLDDIELWGAPTILDCNGNGIPDEDDVQAGTSPDCNENGIPDECDIADGRSTDCNENEVPDSCDLATGTSLDCNANAMPDTCDVQSGFSGDCNGNTVPDECECIPSDAPATDVYAMQKNRYLSVVPQGAGCPTALQVTMVDLPAPFEAFEGQSMWIGPAATVCENAGQATPPPGGCAPAPGEPASSFTAAMLQCEPHYTDWTVGGTVHVYGAAIVPGGRYEVRAIHEYCDPGLSENYSPAFELPTSVWGDLVSDCSTYPCGAPDGTVGVSTDVTAALDKFKNLEGAPTKTRCDIEPGVPDLVVNITDVTCSLDAFRGQGYPFGPTAPPPLCP